MDGTPLKISSPAAQPEDTGFTVRTEPDGRYALIGPDGDVMTTSKDFTALGEIRDNLNGRARTDLLSRRQARRNTVSRLVRDAYGKSGPKPAPVTYIGNELKNRRVTPADDLPPRVADASSLPVLGNGQGVLA
jgi:hypothetical protein